jgi:hypothetical protein
MIAMYQGGVMARYQLTVVLDDERHADILEWFNSQGNKSAAIRQAVRFYMRLQNGGRQQEATGDVTAEVLEALSLELARLPDVVAAAVHNVLAGYRLAAARDEGEPGEEDPELAIRLDAQLDEFFTE